MPAISESLRRVSSLPVFLWIPEVRSPVVWLTSWYKAAPAAKAPEGAPKPAAKLSFRAGHDHFPFGTCQGTFLITEERVIYESVGEATHSRQWGLADIKEAHRKNPYEIEIVPFTGAKYALKLLGQGMDNADFQILVDKITAARLKR